MSLFENSEVFAWCCTTAWMVGWTVDIAAQMGVVNPAYTLGPQHIFGIIALLVPSFALGYWCAKVKP